MKYFLYARKSTETEDKQMASIEDQIAEMQRLAKDFKLQVVDLICESKSAKEPGRKEFNTMLDRIQKGEAEGILCWKLNRLARNPIDGGQISWLLQTNVIKHIQTYGRDYKSSDNVLMMQVEFGMANQYVKDLSEDVKRGMRRKAERGWCPKKLPPGYIHINQKQREHGKPENIPDPVQFPIVRKLWKLLLTGQYPIISIKREGDRFGLCHKNGKVFSKNIYYELFRNEFYCGYFDWKDEQGNSARYKGKHTPMISRSEFEIAQIILGKRKHSRPPTPTYPYRGLITCGECKGHVTADRKLQAICTKCRVKFSIITKSVCKNCNTDISQMRKPTIVDKIYYFCTGNKIQCTQKGFSVTQDYIDEKIEEKLKSISISKEFHDWGLPEIKELNRSFDDDNNKIIKQFKKRETELSQRIEGLIRMRADNEISTTEFNSLKVETAKEIRDIEMKLDIYQSSPEFLDKAITGYFDFALNALEEFKNGDEIAKNRITGKLASNLELKDKKLYISMPEVYKLIKECEMVYHVQNKSFEPKNIVVKYRRKSHFIVSFPVLLPFLRKIRTCLLDIVSKNQKKRE